MSLPSQAQYVIAGAGIHGLSTAWRLAERLTANGESIDGRIVIIDKADRIAAGATGIACGVVRNNYFQPAMRKLMAHSVSIWESDPEAFSYHANGYMQISCEKMRDDVRQIHTEQAAIGYESVFIEGEEESRDYMLNLFDDWQAQGITSVLHEKPGGYANNVKAMEGLSKKVLDLGVNVVLETEITGFVSAGDGQRVTAVETNKGTIECDNLIIGAGPWVRDFWQMLGLPSQIELKDLEGEVHEGIDMWRFWQLEEGVLEIPPETLVTNDGNIPPVLHVDTDAPLYSTVDGSLITDQMWGIYYKPDWGFGGIQGGAAPFIVDKPAEAVAVDPYGPESPEFIVGNDFSTMWVSALAHCQKRFSGTMPQYKDEPSGGIGAFTPDSFPVFDIFHGNCYMIADSNHGYKMLGVGKLVAEDICGDQSRLLEPFRFSRYREGKLHPVSNSPFPWS